MLLCALLSGWAEAGRTSGRRTPASGSRALPCRRMPEDRQVVRLAAAGRAWPASSPAPPPASPRPPQPEAGRTLGRRTPASGRARSRAGGRRRTLPWSSGRPSGGGWPGPPRPRRRRPCPLGRRARRPLPSGAGQSPTAARRRRRRRRRRDPTASSAITRRCSGGSPSSSPQRPRPPLRQRRRRRGILVPGEEEGPPPLPAPARAGPTRRRGRAAVAGGDGRRPAVRPAVVPHARDREERRVARLVEVTARVGVPEGVRGEGV